MRRDTGIRTRNLIMDAALIIVKTRLFMRSPYILICRFIPSTPSGVWQRISTSPTRITAEARLVLRSRNIVVCRLIATPPSRIGQIHTVIPSSIKSRTRNVVAMRNNVAPTLPAFCMDGREVAVALD